MSEHVRETELALLVSGDLRLWKYTLVRLHTSGCQQCRVRTQAYRQDQARLKQEASEMPAGVNWDRLSAEMTANIRVGLAAGECVAPRSRKQFVWGWRPAAAVAGVACLLSAAWWLNLPASDTDSLVRAVRGLVSGRSAPVTEERESVVAASSGGIELRANGSALKISHGTARPVAYSVNTQGSASARYIDTDTDQITITSVYAH